MSTEFAVFVPCTKRFNGLTIYCSKAYSVLDKTMSGRHAVYERQVILSTTVVISHTFCMENENELTPRGAWQ